MTSEELENTVKYLKQEIVALGEVILDKNRQIDRLTNENELVRWAIKGFTAHKVHVHYTYNMPVGEWSGVSKHIAETCAHEVVRILGATFKEHSRIYMMRNHIRYLESHLQAHNIPFHELGENNYNNADVFGRKFEPHKEYLNDILSTMENKK